MTGVSAYTDLSVHTRLFTCMTILPNKSEQLQPSAKRQSSLLHFFKPVDGNQEPQNKLVKLNESRLEPELEPEPELEVEPIPPNQLSGSLEMNTFMFDKLEDPHPTTCSRIKNRFTEDKSNGQHGEKNDPERYEWLGNIRDASGQEGYDPTTLAIPKGQWSKFTPFEKQFWEIKSRHFDTVVFFKKGKFYELYEMDADIASREFDLKLIDRVNMRLAGIPEASFEIWASKFLAAGYKVARVDQMETSIGKSMREKESDAKSEKIINRQLSYILTAGTVVDSSMLNSKDNSFCVAMNVTCNSSGISFGIAMADVSIGKICLTDFVDDLKLTNFETLLTRIQPKELLVARNADIRPILDFVSKVSPRTIITCTKSSELADNSSLEYYLTEKVLKDSSKWPKFLREKCDSHSPSFRSLGFLFSYFEELKLDKLILDSCFFEEFFRLSETSFLSLDGTSLKELDILPGETTSSSYPRNTVLGYLDHCSTAFGRRLLKTWVSQPLVSKELICERFDSVEFFVRNQGLLDSIDSLIRTLPDIERNLCKIKARCIKVKDFTATITAFERMSSIAINHAEAPPLVLSLVAEIPKLRDLVRRWKEDFFDFEKANSEGKLYPNLNIFAEYDECRAAIQGIQRDFERYRIEQEKILRTSGLKYRDIGKEIFQLEVPDSVNVPSQYILMSRTKNARRFYTPELKRLVTRYQEAQETINCLEKKIYLQLLGDFGNSSDVWLRSVMDIAKLDCILSLAKASMLMDEPKCRPDVFDSEVGYFEARELRHPFTLKNSREFIANDILLDGRSKRIILLTGPNMGGKSTLLRQTCIAFIFAQIGCYVPALSCQLSPVERIFTRLGANDNIVSGKSTFMVEMMETVKILKNTNPKTLVILDELGRGTSTFDGMALASAVIRWLIQNNKCIGLFSTHYRMIAEECLREPSLSCLYMSCQYCPEKRRVIFLYKLVEGISPKSYGINVAKIAALPHHVIMEAEKVTGLLESGTPRCGSPESGPSQILLEKVFNAYKQLRCN